jgi:leucine dehydrogenase
MLPHVTGISEERGGAGNPSPVTAYGVYVGMKAAAKQQFGSDVLSGKTRNRNEWAKR